MYDLRVLSLGAGVQSTALYLMALDGLITPRPDVAIFADTQQEPYWVYANVARLEKEGGHIIPIRKPSLGDIADAVRKKIGQQEGRFASVPFWTKDDDGKRGAGRRQCTREYKIDVVVQEARKLLGLKKYQRAAGKYQVEEWIGISMDEARRAKPSRYKWITTRWPFLLYVQMRRAEIKTWLAHRGWPPVGKSACIFCPYRCPAEWAQWRASEPELFEEACRWDEEIRTGGTASGLKHQQFISDKLVPLRELPPPRASPQQDLFEIECEGMCGI